MFVNGLKSGLLIMILAVLLSSCRPFEYVKNSYKQTIFVRTPMVEGAYCQLVDNIGRKWYVPSTPAPVTIKKGHSPIFITCSKTGFKKAYIKLEEVADNFFVVHHQKIDPDVSVPFILNAPKMVPKMLAQVTATILEPYASIGASFPNDVFVWMVPKKFESEAQMREWAYAKKVFFAKEDIKHVERVRAEEHRKQRVKAKWDKRRQVVEDNLNKYVLEPAKEVGYKALSPSTYHYMWRIKEGPAPEGNVTREILDDGS